MRDLFPTFVTVLAALLMNFPTVIADDKTKSNVLFIAVDDLNHWIGHLGRNPQTKTPNIDRLAKMGVTFTNAHCAAPVCNPSRAALLSGMRPGTTLIYDNGQPFGLAISADQSLVTQFRKAGYETLGMGKLWHGGLGFPEQWTATGGPESGDNSAGGKLEDRSIGGIKFGVLNAGDEAVPDTGIADYVIGELSKSHEKPFFVTAGFHKPHMPWNVPKKYFDMHPLDEINLPPTKDGDLRDIPPAGIKMAKPDGDHNDRWRYIRYADGGEELYDHTNDPYEWTNVAALPEHVDLKVQLAALLPIVNNPTVSVEGSAKAGGKKAGKKKQKAKEAQAENRSNWDELYRVADAAPLAEATPVSVRINAKRPTNIVFFVVDDLGQRDLGCYGSTFYDTPHLDQLAKQGALFPNAYAACPVCSPTRASIMTGQYPQRTGITDYIGAAQPDTWKRNTPHLPAPYAEHLALENVTIAEALKAHGYATFFAGKWHLGGDGFSPEDQGFDINMGGLERGGPYGGKKYFSPYGNPKLPDGPEGEHLPDRLASEAAKFIENNRDKPFFVYLPFYDVHTPLMARPDLAEKYQERRSHLKQTDVFGDEPPRKVRLTQDHVVYAGMVDAMDQAVGRVVAKLDELGLAEDTLIIMTSDNGGLSTSEGSPTSNLPLRAGKGWLYEGGNRVSLIMRWPGVISPGLLNESRVISPDYFPTILEAAGLPLEPDHHKDGVSHVASLKSGQPTSSRPLFWHYPHYGNQGGAPGAAVLDGDWKLIEWFDSDTIELFNLASDPGETKNIAANNNELVERLRKTLHAWQSDVGAVRSTANSGYDSSKPNGRG